MPKSAHRPMARRQVRTPRTLAGKLIKPLAGGAAVLLVAGSLVTVGLLQPDPAAADSFTPRHERLRRLRGELHPRG